uniref:Glycoprotein n=1 Tax=Xinmoviridae sp. TaxID=2809225 RepID=A0AB38ZNL6_9MONO
MNENFITHLSQNGDRMEVRLDKSGLTKVSYVSKGWISDGSCTPAPPFIRNGLEYSRPVVNTDVTIVIGIGTAIVDIEEKTIKFPTGASCRYTEESCFDATLGDVFWRVPRPDCGASELSRSLVYEGSGTLVIDHSSSPPLEYVQVNHGGYDFQILLSEKQEYICGYRSRLTEHPNLFFTPLQKDGPAFGVRTQVSKYDVSLMNYVNSKLVYSYRHIKQEVTKLYETFYQDRCKVHNRITQNLLSLAVLSPAEFSFTYAGPGHTSVVRGEVVYLAKCEAVSVLPDISDPLCYNELPVIHNNKTMFMSPRGRVLLPVGNPIDCLPDLMPKYYFNGQWFTKTAHGLVRVNNPEIIKPEEMDYQFSEISSITKGGLYSNDIVEKYQSALVSPIVEDVVGKRLTSSMNGNAKMPEDYLLSNGFGPVDFNNIREEIGGFWGSFSSKAKGIGSWFGFLAAMFLVYKVVIYTISCVLNFREIKKEVGLILAIPLCLIDCICNLILHGRLFAGSGKKTEPESQELRLETAEINMV